MLIAQNLLSVFHHVLKTHNYLSTVLYGKAPKDSGQELGYVSVSLKSSEKYKFKYKLSVAYTLAILLQIIHAVKFNSTQKVSLVALVPSLLFLLSFTFHLPVLREHYRKRKDFCPIFNAFLNFERKHNGLLPNFFIYFGNNY